MIKESNLLGMQVLKDNNRLCNYVVKELIYSSNYFEVKNFILQSITTSKELKVLPYKYVWKITKNGLYIHSESDLVNIDQVLEVTETMEKHKTLVDYEVYSKKGEIIAKVKDILFEKRSGKVLGLIISEGLLEELMNGYVFLPLKNGANFEEDKIILNESLQNNILPLQGGLKKILGIDIEN